MKVTKGGLISYRKAKAKEYVQAAVKISDPLAQIIDKITTPLPSVNGVTVSLECCRPQSLDSNTLDELFSILKSNMQTLYEQSSWGWDEQRKRDEVFSPKARLLICRVPDVTTAIDGSSGLITGFLSFRFEREDQDPVLYCYDIQLRKEYCGFSIGRYLMNTLVPIAEMSRMDRILLTVFRANKNGLGFFRHIGFDVDKTDPSKFPDVEKVDYKILSKPMKY